MYRALELLGGHASLTGLKVAIIGSVEPWYEAICLAFGAAECVSVDYNPVYYNHPRLSWASISDLQADSEAAGTFDVALSISSVEHDGLGRYGDPLDPDADLAAMGFLRHLLSPGGRALLAVPVGGDLLRWNMHRIYGKHRLPLLLAGWTVIAAEGWHPHLLLQVGGEWGGRVGVGARGGGGVAGQSLRLLASYLSGFLHLSWARPLQIRKHSGAVPILPQAALSCLTSFPVASPLSPRARHPSPLSTTLRDALPSSSGRELMQWHTTSLFSSSRTPTNTRRLTRFSLVSRSCEPFLQTSLQAPHVFDRR